MTPEIAPYVSALSVMLAAYGFFYNAYKSRIEGAEDVGAAAGTYAGRQAQITKVKRARMAARVLAGIPLIVFAVFAPKLWEKLKALPHSHAYSALDVAFGLLVCSWLVIAIVVALQAKGLTGKLGELSKNVPPKP